MLSAILKSPGAIEIQNVPVPEPAEGELLVKVKAALTCGTDLKAYLRGHSLIPMPGPFGHEFSGIVAARGKGVRRFKEGDAVMSVHSAPCLKCAYCVKGLFNLCENIMASKVLGAFSEYILIPRHVVSQNVFKKPGGLGFKEAAFLEPLSCVVHSVESMNIGSGDTALIIGAGPIGLLHLMLLKHKGAKVMMTGLEEDRLKTAKKLGADAVFHPSETAARAGDFSHGMGVDYVFECTGQPDVWESSVDYVRRGGTVVLFGGCKKDTDVTFSAERIHYDEITLRGIFHFTPQDVKKAFNLLKSNKIDVKQLITATCSLREVASVFPLLAKGKGIKYVVVP
ncbi:MAG: zinc-binding dehydrogenase [Thermodesulfovibrionales bacterium]